MLETDSMCTRCQRFDSRGSSNREASPMFFIVSPASSRVRPVARDPELGLDILQPTRLPCFKLSAEMSPVLNLFRHTPKALRRRLLRGLDAPHGRRLTSRVDDQTARDLPAGDLSTLKRHLRDNLDPRGRDVVNVASLMRGRVCRMTSRADQFLSSFVPGRPFFCLGGGCGVVGVVWFGYSQPAHPCP
jgi:hypothetical protein